MAFDLNQAGQKVVVLEMAAEMGAGASRTNSGILHTGFDSKPGALETALIRAQCARWPSLFDALKIPYKVPGAVLLARNAEEAGKLEAIAAHAAQNGVGVELLGQSKAQQLEPNLRSEAGLKVPDEAMTDPLAVTHGLLAGTEVRLSSRVLGIEEKGDWLEVSTSNSKLQARFAVNCAGLFGDEFLGDPGFKIIPRRGEFLVFPKDTAGLINHTILPVPNEFTKGILAFTTLHGHLIVGPTAENQQDKTDWTPSPKGLQLLWQKAAELLPQLASTRPVDAWAGLRPHGEPQTYRLEFSPAHPRLLHLAAIRSTGLSACLGISQYALQMLLARDLLPLSPPFPTTSPLPPSPSPLHPWWQSHNALRGVNGAALVESLHAPGD